MWGASVTAPSATNLRILAKEGKLSKEDSNKVLNLPVSFETVSNVFLKNKNLLLKEFSHDIGIPFHIAVFEHLHEYVPIEDQELVIFDDENRDTELVYGIGLNNARKKIVLVFRGSVSKMDYKVDYAVKMKSVPNPVPHQARWIKVHTGYMDYLDGKQDGNGSKFDKIVTHLKNLLIQYPNYGIYISGHSLGGSLANLMAFQLAGVPEIPSPITVITFGALLIGDVRFQRAFQKYEDEKRIRCIGVMNDGDVIPLLPPQGYINAYCHIGTKVLLSDKKATITRDPQARCLLGAYILNAPSHVLHWCRLLGVVCCRKNFGENHSVLAYSHNLTCKGVERVLKELTVDDVCTPGSFVVRTAM
jgi:hypothetical protein